MVLLFDSGAFRLSDKGRPQSGLFFSLETSDQLEAAKRANEHARRQDALWANHLGNGSGKAIDSMAALGRLEAAGLKPGDGLRHQDSPALEDLVQAFTGGAYEQGEYRPAPDPQSRLALDLLMGKQVPRTLSDAQDKHIALGKGQGTRLLSSGMTGHGRCSWALPETPS